MVVHHPQPVSQLPAGSLIADIGCGNGKYLTLRPPRVMLGADRSVNLLDICRARGHDVLACDTVLVPFRCVYVFFLTLQDL